MFKKREGRRRQTKLNIAGNKKPAEAGFLISIGAYSSKL